MKFLLLMASLAIGNGLIIDRIANFIARRIGKHMGAEGVGGSEMHFSVANDKGRANILLHSGIAPRGPTIQHEFGVRRTSQGKLGEIRFNTKMAPNPQILTNQMTSALPKASSLNTAAVPHPATKTSSSKSRLFKEIGHSIASGARKSGDLIKRNGSKAYQSIKRLSQ